MRALLPTIIILLMSTNLMALDIITMRNGDIYRGDIIRQENNQFIQVRFSDGNEKRLDFKDVAEITRDELPPAPVHETETISRETFITIGWITLGVSYGLTAGVSAVAGGSYSFIPIAGPFLQMAYTNTHYLSPLLASGVVQLGSAVLLAIAYLQKEEHPKESALNFVPVGPHNSMGLSFAMSF